MAKILELKDIRARVKDGPDILHGVNLTVRSGETHVIMGPNGGGKSTLAQVVMGHPAYVLTAGSIILDKQDITNATPDIRAKAGLFLGFQYPSEVAGVNFAKFLRLSAAAVRDSPIDAQEFRSELREVSHTLGFKDELARRALNEGFSGGEKKKAEIVQLQMLRPNFAILDEPDSGLDVDALRDIAAGLQSLDYPIGLLLITHYQRILDHIRPDYVHVMLRGRIVESGDHTLAGRIDRDGYGTYR